MSIALRFQIGVTARATDRLPPRSQVWPPESFTANATVGSTGGFASALTENWLCGRGYTTINFWLASLHQPRLIVDIHARRIFDLRQGK